jgi:hypothetical protein
MSRKIKKHLFYSFFNYLCINRFTGFRTSLSIINKLIIPIGIPVSDFSNSNFDSGPFMINFTRFSDNPIIRIASGFFYHIPLFQFLHWLMPGFGRCQGTCPSTSQKKERTYLSIFRRRRNQQPQTLFSFRFVPGQPLVSCDICLVFPSAPTATWPTWAPIDQTRVQRISRRSWRRATPRTTSRSVRARTLPDNDT